MKRKTDSSDEDIDRIEIKIQAVIEQLRTKDQQEEETMMEKKILLHHYLDYIDEHTHTIQGSDIKILVKLYSNRLIKKFMKIVKRQMTHKN